MILEQHHLNRFVLFNVLSQIKNLKIEVIIFETHYRYRVEHSRKYMETYFVSLISALKRI